jgi:transposase
MPRKRRSYTEEFRAEVVEMIRRGDRSVLAICKDLDLTESAVRRWVEKANKSAPDVAARNAKNEPTGPLSKSEREELVRLRRENRTLQMEREILKKATAFFAKENS